MKIRPNGNKRPEKKTASSMFGARSTNPVYNSLLAALEEWWDVSMDHAETDYSDDALGAKRDGLLETVKEKLWELNKLIGGDQRPSRGPEDLTGGPEPEEPASGPYG
jgi:hypothetical protein